jgi:hypothetical protein
MCHDYAVRSDDSFCCSLLFSSISSCTILRLQSMTPRITCDSKSPMTDGFGPLARLRFSVRYPIDSCARPSPLWAYNTFSYVLFLSFGLVSSLVPISSIPFCSTPFYCASDLICFHSIPFDSLRFVSPLFATTLRLARDLRVSLYINHCTI